MSLWKPIAEYHLKESCTSIAWVASIYTAFIVAIVLFRGVIINITYSDSSYVSFGGAEFIFAITMLIVCMSSFKEDIQFLLQHGISRWTGFVGFKLHLSIASVICAVVALSITAIVSLFQEAGVNTFAFVYIYGGWLSAVGVVPGFLVHFLWIWALFFTVGTLGYFLTALFNNLNTLGKILVGVGVIIVLPMINNLTGGLVVRVLDWLSLMFRGSGDVINPLNGIGFFLVLSAITLVFSWLLVRRYRLNK